MKYSTLFLIASAVLAMPTGQNADTIELAKKDAAPFRGSYMGSGYRDTLGNQFKNHNNENSDNSNNNNAGNSDNYDGENYDNYDVENYDNYDNVEYAKRDAAPFRGSYMGSGWRNTLGNQFKNNNNNNNKREDSEDVELAKKDAAPAGGWVFPTAEQDDPTNEKYLLKGENGEVPGMDAHGKNMPQQEVAVKDRKDKSGNSCQNYKDKEVKDIPEECMKTVFCVEGIWQPLCDAPPIFKDSWTKQQLLDFDVSRDCIYDSICYREDFY